MSTFIILCLGQLFSSVGSSMTYFALTLWIWQKTQSATTVALILVFYQLPQLIITPISGILVDRISRKKLLIISDTGSAFCTISLAILSFYNVLSIWHIYLIASIIGCFSNIQSLTYQTLIPLILQPKDHSRAISMGVMTFYGAEIFSPALAGVLFPLIGLSGITMIDVSTFAIALSTILLIKIPHISNAKTKITENPFNNLIFGFRYIYSHRRLLILVMMVCLFNFFNDMGETLYQPMILAQTSGNTEILGMVVAGGGIGGVVGSIIITVWGGFKQHRKGIFTGFLGTGLSTFILALTSIPSLWILTKFAWSFHQPLMMSSYMAIWYAKTSTDIQGRVFAADYLLDIVVNTSASLTAGILADRIFEPLMQSQFPSGTGMALLIGVNAFLILCLTVGMSKLRLWNKN